MSYAFPPDLREIIQRQLMGGGYRSEDDVLRDALRALEDQQVSTTVIDPVVVMGVQRGIDEMNAGLGRSFEEFDTEFRATRNIPGDV